MTELVHYALDAGVATIRLDDGKRNALPPAMFEAIDAALDRAEEDRAIVILTGRADVFSAGFDLKVLKKGGLETLRMLRLGYSLPPRIMTHPYPVIAACNGHVLAMGVFMMLACDHVIGCRGDFRISANEVALGLTMPRVAAAMLEHRLDPAAYQRAVTLAEYFSPEAARRAGFFDELARPEELMPRARELASELAKLDMRAHAASKRRIRRATVRTLRASLPFDLIDAAVLGLRAAWKQRQR
jgi:enoyl-CoA hydratase